MSNYVGDGWVAAERPQWLVKVYCKGGSQYEWVTGERVAVAYYPQGADGWVERVFPVWRAKRLINICRQAVDHVTVERY